ncbi:type VI secretion system ATPase TssH [Jiella sp. MQZ9-1]|uniref:Type VI secretion system ATPase TssH n=1 Tax=Jiella flava TaxID=2816857 RepID=A0A939FXN4_9HYPH|nr:type VI secretion system ATPase TssH [Jiella flava]MBO0662656.1 type VI secretion system ATPase TssH [Jiella flava]MCD2471078.1 type VI secretion system ATPase TssH [Jiella flava]
MPQISVEKLIQNLDPACRSDLESAAAMAARSTHRTVEVVHWLRAIVDVDDGRLLMDRLGVPTNTVRAELDAALADLPASPDATLTLSQNLIELAREAYVRATLQHGRRQVCRADLIACMLDETSLRAVLRGIAPSLREARREVLDAELAASEPAAPSSVAPSFGGDQSVAGAGAHSAFLDQYTQDLTAAAREGRIDPVIGREAELRQVVDVLMRRRQNNPILVGEAGVGKTAVAEALALAIAADTLPERLAEMRLLSLDLGLLEAGAGIKGEFERRLRGVIDEVKASTQPIILFIDEAHMLMGGGRSDGQGAAANLLKPALARGELRTLAATTFSEYKRHIEKDAALARRFQAVKIDEPDEDRAIAMLRGVADRFETHHGVVIRYDALVAAVRLSARYIPDRQLPDKAISLVDTAAAAVALSRHGSPDPVRVAEAEIERLSVEAAWLERQPASGEGRDRLAAIADRQAELSALIAAMREQLEAERERAEEADRIETILARINDGPSAAAFETAEGAIEPAATVAVFPGGEKANDRAALQLALARAERELKTIGGEAPLLRRVVDAEGIASVVARWTGIPVGKLLADQVSAVETLEARLKERVIGQDAALDRIAAAMRSARAGLSDPRRPPAVLLLVGMSGTGKTETALSLADLLYGGTQYLTTINMSEFKEEHKVSMLVGAPPGYVGYGEGGVLTEAVRRRPYGVLLLDEIDKAHPGVQDVFYQLFDKGVLRDGEGRDVDFKNTTIVMTANSASELIAELAEDPETMPTGEAFEALIAEELGKHFKPAFLGRTTILPYNPLTGESLAAIVDLQIAKVAARIVDRYGARLSLAEPARDALVNSAKASVTGARAIEAMIARDLLPELSSVFLKAMLDGGRITEIMVDHETGTGFTLAPVFADPEEFADPEAAADEAASEALDVAQTRRATTP